MKEKPILKDKKNFFAIFNIKKADFWHKIALSIFDFFHKNVKYK